MDEAVLPGAEGGKLRREAAELLASGRIQEARLRYSEAIRLNPLDLEARDGLVNCLVALGNAATDRADIDRAIAHFQNALELSPFHPEADAGLRRADALSKRRAPGGDPLGEALESLPPVKVYRDLQRADRIVGRVAGTPPPSQILQGSLDARREGLKAGGAPPRAHRIEHEMAAAWRHRWFYRSLPVLLVAASLVLYLLVGNFGVLNWGLLLGGFAALWDWIFVERASVAARRLEPPG